MLWFPELPPSTNHMYTTGAFGRRILTKTALAWKNRAKSYLWKEYPDYLEKLCLYLGKDYFLHLTLIFQTETLVNGTYGQKSGAVERYKKLDVSNRIKLVEDAIAEAINIDDRRYQLTIIKSMGVPEGCGLDFLPVHPGNFGISSDHINDRPMPWEGYISRLHGTEALPYICVSLAMPDYSISRSMQALREPPIHATSSRRDTGDKELPGAIASIQKRFTGRTGSTGRRNP